VVAKQVPILINFVDFRKAFDSVHRGSLWKIMKKYGIPTKIIEIFRSLYDDGRSAVSWGGVVGEWFQVMTGVQQGCALSPVLFVLVVDWVMKRTTKGRNFGLRWIDEDRLGVVDFADDIALLEDTQEGVKDFTYKMQEEAAKVGLLMNPDRCKIMKIGKWNDTGGITIGGNEIEMVDAFCYQMIAVATKR